MKLPESKLQEAKELVASNLHVISTSELEHILYVLEMLEGEPDMIEEEHVQDAYEIIRKLLNKEVDDADAEKGDEPESEAEVQEDAEELA